MADEDQTSKTEQPTERRLEEARKSGDLPFSKDLSFFSAMVMLVILIMFWAPYAAKQCVNMVAIYISPGTVGLEIGHGEIVRTIINVCLFSALLIFLPSLAWIIILVLGHMAQHGFHFTIVPFKLDISRISMVKGLKKIASIENIYDAILNTVKAILICIIIYKAISQLLVKAMMGFSSNIAINIENSVKIMRKMIIYATLAMGFVGGVDYIYKRYKYRKKLMMSPHDIKEELRQTDGDPLIKSRMKGLMRAKAKQRMMSALKTADVVIMNPTHYAVALFYDPKKMPAPKVVAKGVNELALRIKAVAIENNVEVISNPPIARLIYDTVKLDHYIKPEQYELIARLMYNILKLKGKL